MFSMEHFQNRFKNYKYRNIPQTKKRPTRIYNLDILF